MAGPKFHDSLSSLPFRSYGRACWAGASFYLFTKEILRKSAADGKSARGASPGGARRLSFSFILLDARDDAEDSR